MRPARSLIALCLGIAALSLLIGLITPAGATYALVLWGGLALVALADLLASPGPRRYRLTADAPGAGFVGSEVPLALTIATLSGALPARIALRLGHDAHLAPEAAEVSLTPEPGAQSHALQLPIRLRARGQGRLDRLWLCFPSRFGLFEILPSWPLDLTISIHPDIAPVLNGDIQMQMLPLTDGLKTMRLRGQGSEFHQFRDFQPDMDPRMIDWKRSARMHRLVARETRAERNHQIILCLDSGHLMGERIGSLSRFDLALNAALGLAWAGGLGGDTVGFYSFGSRPGKFLPPRPGRAAFGLIRAETADLFPEEAQSNHTLGLTHLNSMVSRRSLVVVFSDFSDSVTVDLLVENLAVIRRQHLVLYVALRDPEISALMRPEQGDLDAVALAVAARQVTQERQSVLDRLNRLGVLCLDTTPERLTAALISRYIDIKARELI
ncbi:DUF58 domain-containing protein [Phaeovulum sp. W22_SRMD_FR3]|uniref:DUF58 domain-containing protein n=1 Tax=Phaeovulum sp. W22_SRMD_FR3 TaxID=3240274 RepID=UPI003F9949B6